MAQIVLKPSCSQTLWCWLLRNILVLLIVRWSKHKGAQIAARYTVKIRRYQFRLAICQTFVSRSYIEGCEIYTLTHRCIDVYILPDILHWAWDRFYFLIPTRDSWYACEAASRKDGARSCFLPWIWIQSESWGMEGLDHNDGVRFFRDESLRVLP